MHLYDTYCTQSEHDHSLIIHVIFLSIQMQSVRILLKLIWRRANGLTGSQYDTHKKGQTLKRLTADLNNPHAEHTGNITGKL